MHGLRFGRGRVVVVVVVVVRRYYGVHTIKDMDM